MPRDDFAEVIRQLEEAITILDSHLDSLNDTDGEHAVLERLSAARERIRAAIKQLKHAEES